MPLKIEIQRQQLKEILNDPNISRIINQLEHGNVLFRGVRGRDDLDFYKRLKPTEDRVPSDSDPKVINFLENYRRKHFPQIPSRQRAAFCWSSNTMDFVGISTNRRFFIFPDNSANYFQSRTVGDFFGSEIYNKIYHYISDGKLPHDESIEEEINGYYKNANRNLAMIEFTKNGREVFFEYDYYYGISNNVLVELYKEHAYTVNYSYTFSKFLTKLPELYG